MCFLTLVILVNMSATGPPIGEDGLIPSALLLARPSEGLFATAIGSSEKKGGRKGGKLNDAESHSGSITTPRFPSKMSVWLHRFLDIPCPW